MLGSHESTSSATNQGQVNGCQTRNLVRAREQPWKNTATLTMPNKRYLPRFFIGCSRKHRESKYVLKRVIYRHIIHPIPLRLRRVVPNQPQQVSSALSTLSIYKPYTNDNQKGRLLEDHNPTDISAAREAPINNNHESNTGDTEEVNNTIAGQQRQKTLPSKASKAKKEAAVPAPRKGIHPRALPLSRTAKKEPAASNTNNNKSQGQGPVNENVRVTRAAVARKHVRAISRRKTRATTLKQSLAIADSTISCFPGF